MAPDIEEHIRKAIEEGKFDNLSGKGKPLNLDENAFEDDEWRMAYHILQNGGFTLPWIETRQEILAGIEQARADLGRAFKWRKDSQTRDNGNLSHPIREVEAEWQRARKHFGDQVEKINKLIFDYNLETPSSRFQIQKLVIEREIRSITGEK